MTVPASSTPPIETGPTVLRDRRRFHAIDAIRGFCLLNIFINHIWVGVLNRASPSNLGLSDSADLFVFLAGVSVYLASGDLRFQRAVGHLWRRAASLYLHNLVLIAVGLASLAVLGHVVGAEVLVEGGLLKALEGADILTAAWHLLTFQQSVGYSVVLRLYIALMLLAPVLIWFARKRWWLALPVVAAVWAVSGHFELVTGDTLTEAPRALAILPWTLIFGLGVTLGAALKQGVPLPRSRLLLAGAITIVAGYVVFLAIAKVSPDGQAWLTARNDDFWFGGSKTFQSPLRVLHVLSLVYIFLGGVRAPVLRLVHGVGPDNVFARLGRRSLPVFVTGAMIAAPANEIVNLVNRQWGALSVEASSLSWPSSPRASC